MKQLNGLGRKRKIIAYRCDVLQSDCRVEAL